MKRLHLLFWFICAVCATNRVYGHGFAGARFFPATLSTDDPFVSDELSLPTVSTIRTPDDGGTRETDISVDIAKRITPEFGIEIGETLSVVNPHEGQTANGFGNLELGGKYQLLKNGPRMKQLYPWGSVSRLAVLAPNQLAQIHSARGSRRFFLVKASGICPRRCGF